MIKKIAFVDVDDCLLLHDGTLNPTIVQRLKTGGYQEITLFTQRGKYMQSVREGQYKIALSNNAMFTITDVMQALKQEGINAKFSSSVSPYIEKPANYLKDFARFENRFQQCIKDRVEALQQLDILANGPPPLSSEEKSKREDAINELYDAGIKPLNLEVLQELQTIAKKLAPEEITAMAEKSHDQKTATDDKATLIASECERLRALQAKIMATDLSKIDLENPSLMSSLLKSWSNLYPTNKNKQYDEGMRLAGFDGSEIEVDYYDDSTGNFYDLIRSRSASNAPLPHSLVVIDAFIMPFSIYDEKFKTLSTHQIHQALTFKTIGPITADDLVRYLNSDVLDEQAFGRQCLTVVMNNPNNALLTQRVDQYFEGLNLDPASKKAFQAYLCRQDKDTFIALLETSPKITSMADYDANQRIDNQFDALFDRYTKTLAEVCYQNHLIERATQQDSQQRRFDPQGSMLTEVTLDEQDYKAILTDILVKSGAIALGTDLENSSDNSILLELNQRADAHYKLLPQEDDAPRPSAPYRYQELLQAQMGTLKPLSSTTICNIDVSTNQSLVNDYRQWLTSPSKTPQPLALTRSWQQWIWLNNPIRSESDKEEIRQDVRNAFQTRLVAATNQLLTKNDRSEAGSINAIQEEMEMHMGLALRVLEKAFSEASLNSPELTATLTKIRTAAAHDINEQVKTIFQRALVQSHHPQTGYIDYVQLNTILDLARKELATPENCYGMLRTQCQQFIVDFDTMFTLAPIQAALTKKAFESTTASADDYLSANALGLNARISGSDNTAHHKEAGLHHQASRIIHYSDGSLMMRLPSIPDMKNKKWRFEDHVGDSAEKINEATRELRQALGDYQGPVILNRETAIPHKWFDTNKQAKRVAIEMNAIHVANAQTINPFTDTFNTTQLTFIQNLSVNGHSDNLGYDKSGILKEATLMTEMAMLANLHHQVSKGVLTDVSGIIKTTYDNVMENYRLFLSQAMLEGKLDNSTFSTSLTGDNAITSLLKLKTALTQLPSQTPSNNAKTMANQALLQIFAHDLHLNQNNGMLIQSLATFAQDATIAGCKSANERFAAVESRAILMRLIAPANTPLRQAKAEITQALHDLIVQPHPRIEHLQDTVSTHHNKHTVQFRAAAAVSGLDQGAAAKLKTFFKYVYRSLHFLNTNQADSSLVTRLITDNTSEMQAHNKVAKHAKAFIQTFFKGQPKLVERTFEADSPLKSFVDVLSKELAAIKANTYIYDKRIAPLTALIKAINNPYSVMSATEVLKKADSLVKDGSANFHALTTLKDQYPSERFSLQPKAIALLEDTPSMFVEPESVVIVDDFFAHERVSFASIMPDALDLNPDSISAINFEDSSEIDTTEVREVLLVDPTDVITDDVITDEVVTDDKQAEWSVTAAAKHWSDDEQWGEEEHFVASPHSSETKKRQAEVGVIPNDSISTGMSSVSIVIKTQINDKDPHSGLTTEAKNDLPQEPVVTSPLTLKSMLGFCAISTFLHKTATMLALYSTYFAAPYVLGVLKVLKISLAHAT